MRHHHFVDTSTGRIYDIPFEQVPTLEKSLDGKYKVKNYTVTFYGDRAEDS
jgi:Fe2+ or Zn2+ uptake regulation protein